MRRSAILPVLPVLLLAILPALLDAQRGRVDRVRRALTFGDYVEAGLVGGPNRNTVTGAGPVDAKIRGFGGAFLTIPVAGDLRIRPEALLSGKNVGESFEIQPPCLPPGGCPPITQRRTAAFTWLEVPILAEVRFPGMFGRGSMPRLYGGPFLGVRLSCSFVEPVGAPVAETGSGQAAGSEIVSPCDPPNGPGPRYNNGDAGFVLGGTLGVRGIGIGARWTRSLVPVAPDQVLLGSTRLIGAKHSTLALTLELTTRIY